MAVGVGLDVGDLFDRHPTKQPDGERGPLAADPPGGHDFQGTGAALVIDGRAQRDIHDGSFQLLEQVADLLAAEQGDARDSTR